MPSKRAASSTENSCRSGCIAIAELVFALNMAGLAEDLTGGGNDAAKWQDGSLIRLPSLASSAAGHAFGINDQGIVVGRTVSFGGDRATLWDDTGAWDLNSFLRDADVSDRSRVQSATDD